MVLGRMRPTIPADGVRHHSVMTDGTFLLAPKVESGQYQGDISIADCEEVVAPDAQVPDNATVRDPLIATGTSDVNDRPLRVAVMSDAQFVARDPEGANVEHARDTIRQIVAAKPDLMVIDGDFVDEASEADLKFAKQILAEEADGKVPYLYVPGNHEAMGDKDISLFEKIIGSAHTTKDVKGIRIITLDSSNDNLHGRGTGQLVDLERQLADAKTNKSVKGVLVFTHMPIDDFLPSKNSQLGDRYEAEQLKSNLEAFRDESGKGVAMINGHVGAFNATSFGGVSQLTNGNSGKGPSSTVDNGGFIGWTMLGINPSAGSVGSVAEGDTLARLKWLRAQTNPQIDADSLKVVDDQGQPVTSLTLKAGSALDLKAIFTQEDGTRTVPVQWPVSFVWSGDGVAVDDGLDTKAAETTGQIVRMEAATGRLTAVSGGTVTLHLSVNGQTVSVPVTVTSVSSNGGNGQQNGSTGAGKPSGNNPSGGNSSGESSGDNQSGNPSGGNSSGESSGDNQSGNPSGNDSSSNNASGNDSSSK